MQTQSIFLINNSSKGNKNWKTHQWSIFIIYRLKLEPNFILRVWLNLK